MMCFRRKPVLLARLPAHAGKIAARIGIACGVCLMTLFAFHARSQVLTGEITGTVRDTTGAVIPGATVTIRNTSENQVQRVVQTNSQGQFVAPLMAIGSFTLRIDAKGFQTSTVRGVQVNIGHPVAVPVTMSLGSSTQSVTVRVNTVTPQLDTAAAGTLIDNRQMTQLSLSSRNFAQLLYLQPGVSSGIPGPDTRGNFTSTGAVNSQNFSVNGLGSLFNGYYLDGADMVKRNGNQPIVYPGIDFVHEMNLQRSNYGAEYGGPGAAVISLQTRSGTTAFHGRAFEFFRSQILDANGYFNNRAGLPRPGRRYNDYGFALGGPVYIPHVTDRRTSKTFFFVGQEYLREETSAQTNITNIPTAAQRQGIFGVPVCIAYNRAGKCTQSATTISSIDPTAQDYLKDILDKLPLPNNPNDPQGLIYYEKGILNETQTIIRIDQQFNQKLSAFFRYLDDPYHILAPDGVQAQTQVPGVGTSNVTDGTTNWLGHATYVINQNNVIEGGFASRQDWVTAQAIGYMAQSNSPDIRPRLPYPSTLGVVPHLSIFGSAYAVDSPYQERNGLTQIFVNETSTLGRHTLQFGVNLEYQNGGTTATVNNAGTFVFSPGAIPVGGASKFDQAFADFLEGNVSRFTQDNIAPGNAPHDNNYDAYVQDDFRPTPRLTLNGGVRYGFIAQGTPGAISGFPELPLVNFDPATFNPADAPTIDSNGLICTKAPCVGGGTPNASYNPQNGLIISSKNSPYGKAVTSQPYLTFEPRVGFAWDVRGDGRTALRGGYGVYDLLVGSSILATLANSNYPNVITTTISNTSFGDPGNGIPVGSKSPVSPTELEPNTKTPYVQAWSLDFQQQLGSDSVLDIGYYGNRVVHNSAKFEVNQPRPGAFVKAGIIPGNVVTVANTQKLNQIRPYLGYESIASLEPLFSSNYNGLQVSFQHRVRNGTIFALNYTWSKALSNVRVPQNIFDLGPEYGPDPNMRTNIFNANFVYPFPFYQTQSGITGRLLGGWEVTGIVSYGSGQYSTASDPATDPGGIGLLAGPATGRPDIVGNPNSRAPHTVGQWFNTSAFVPVPAGQYRPGNDPVSNILGPGYENWDLSLFKNLSFAHGFNMQLRAEAFNVFNHVNYANIATELGKSNFGQVTSAGSARVMQLGAKLNF